MNTDTMNTDTMHERMPELFRSWKAKEKGLQDHLSCLYKVNGHLCKIKDLIKESYTTFAHYSDYSNSLRVYINFRAEDVVSLTGFSTTAIRDILLDEIMDAIGCKTAHHYSKKVDSLEAIGAFEFDRIFYDITVYGRTNCTTIVTEELVKTTSYKC